MKMEKSTVHAYTYAHILVLRSCYSKDRRTSYYIYVYIYISYSYISLRVGYHCYYTRTSVNNNDILRV